MTAGRPEEEKTRRHQDKVPAPSALHSLINRDARLWENGYEAGRRVGWLDALDFAFSRDGERASMDPTVLDEMACHLRGDNPEEVGSPW